MKAPRTAGEAIERMTDLALAEAEEARLAELRAHPKQVEIRYLIDGREATEQELQDLAAIQHEAAIAQQEFLDRFMAVHNRVKWWLALVARIDARRKRLVAA